MRIFPRVSSAALAGLLITSAATAGHTPAQPAELHQQSPRFEQAFSPGQGATDLVVRTIQGARQSIDVAAYSFTSHAIATALIKAAKSGAHVAIVADAAPRSMSDAVRERLIGAGIEIRSCPQFAAMHDKFMIVDGATIETGSFNYTVAAERNNAENVLVIHDAPQAVINAYRAQWNTLWTTCPLAPQRPQGRYDERSESGANYGARLRHNTPWVVRNFTVNRQSELYR